MRRLPQTLIILALLAATVHRHEQVFGVVETDIRKRVKST